jgi:hypothetical protein
MSANTRDVAPVVMLGSAPLHLDPVADFDGHQVLGNQWSKNH